MKEHTVTLRVRYGETDQMGVVYHGHYFSYFEVGRTELLRAAGVINRDLELDGLFLVVTEASCRYRSNARYDEELRVVARVAGLGKATVRFDYAILGPDGRLVAEGHTELASLDRSRRPVRMPESVVSRLC
jgi:acyl-CoA thioester hydrolase